MNRTLVAFWLALSIAILACSTFAMLWWSQRQSSSSQRLDGALVGLIKPYKNQLAAVIESYRLDFLKQLSEVDASNNFDYGSGNVDRRLDPTSWMPFQRDPRIQQIIVLDRNNRLIYPSNLSTMTTADQAFVVESLAVMKQGAFRPVKNDFDVSSNGVTNTPLQSPNASALPSQSPQAQSRSFTLSNSNIPNPTENFGNAAVIPGVLSRRESGAGWTSWYYGQLMVIGFWSQYSDGTLVMLTVPRSRVLADLIGGLPDNASAEQANAGSLFRINDSDGRTLHQWGQTELVTPSNAGKIARASLALERPFENLQIQVYADLPLQQALVPPESMWPMVASIASLTGVLLLLGAQVTLAFNRQLRIARQQVSFVNQVSHELRTPLTNISMYAELAQRSIDADSNRAEDRAQLARLDIIQQETKRLNRLINNVLQFERADQDLPMKLQVVDVIVQHSLAMFEPRLLEKGIVVKSTLHCNTPVQCNADAIEQIVVNLISNAEKYAASGKMIGITTSIVDDQVIIRVWDHGPGIPNRLRSSIFDPFVRASHALESPSGTGIGLSIVRQLARMHGGDCVLASSEHGACFECILRIRKSPTASVSVATT